VTRARIPLSAFRVPEGKLALTLLLHGRKGLTAVFDASDIDAWLAGFEAGMGIEMTDRAESWTHVQIRELLRRALDNGSADLDTCTAAALWLALNHPFGSETVRRHVSSSLCRDVNVEIVRRCDTGKFVVLPKRWISGVEGIGSRLRSTHHALKLARSVL
jgi:hypothetical protein